LKKIVLFVDNFNSVESQIAEIILNQCAHEIMQWINDTFGA
jgi:protein-tyrosine-phosphatase